MKTTPSPPPIVSRSIITDHVEHLADTDPDRVAFIFEDRATSYAELHRDVRAFARSLLAAGVATGDRVALLSTPRPEFLVSYLATLSIGGIWMGLNPRYSVRELAYVLSDAKPVVVLSLADGPAPNYPDALREALAEANLFTVPMYVFGPLADSGDMDLDDFLELGTSFSDEDLISARANVDPNDPALIVYTSGSSGQPKGALLRHSGIVRLGRVQAAQWGISEPRIVCNQPVNHIGCVGDLCSVTLLAGGSIVFAEKFDASETLRLIERHRVSGLFQIPTQLQRIAEAPEFAATDLSRLRLVGWGGAPLSPRFIRKFRDRGCALSTTYGLTEVTSSVSYTRADASDDELANTVGMPDPELQVRLRRSDGAWASETESGEICVKHPTVMAGYLNRPEQTAEAFTADGWLRTGDLGEFREDGNLRLVGRLSEMYKSGGYNIYPREIEAVLESFPGVALAAVVPRPDPDYFEVGVAFVQFREGEAEDLDGLRSWCQDRLANYKIPKEFHIGNLQLLSNGKIDKQVLRKRAELPRRK